MSHWCNSCLCTRMVPWVLSGVAPSPPVPRTHVPSRSAFFLPVEAFLHGWAHLSGADNNWHNPTWQFNLLCKINENWFSRTVKQMQHFSLYCGLFLPSPTLKSRAWKSYSGKAPTLGGKVRRERFSYACQGTWKWTKLGTEQSTKASKQQGN